MLPSRFWWQVLEPSSIRNNNNKPTKCLRKWKLSCKSVIWLVSFTDTLPGRSECSHLEEHTFAFTRNEQCGPTRGVCSGQLGFLCFLIECHKFWMFVCEWKHTVSREILLSQWIQIAREKVVIWIESCQKRWWIECRLMLPRIWLSRYTQRGGGSAVQSCACGAPHWEAMWTGPGAEEKVHLRTDSCTWRR